MGLIRSLRMMRWAPAAAVVVAAACEHGSVNQVIALDGDTVILNVSLSATGAGGTPAGSRTVNRFLLTSFDTAIADAFGRSSTNPVNFFREQTCGYGTTAMILPSGSGTAPTYLSPNRYLPSLPYQIRMVDGCGGGQSTNYIVQKGHPGNGANNQVWEFWFHADGTLPSARYIMGLARYQLQVRGALDISELLLTGTVAQPDTLVFAAGDFNPAGKKSRDGFTTSCTSANVVHPVAGANPHYLGSDTMSLVSNQIDLDQTACATTGEAWSNLGTATSPIPSNNNTALGANQYNFFVIWEALADSTPDYTKPVFRSQVGPLLSTSGAVINNGYGPVPPAALTGPTLAVAPGGNGTPDSVTVNVSNLAPLSNATYQVWFTETGTTNAALATGNFFRIRNNAVVDSALGVTGFDGDTVSGTTLRMVIDYAPIAPLGEFNSLVVALAPAGGGTALPASQPLATTIQKKVAGGAIPVLTRNLTFGNFDNGGAAQAPWGPAGDGRGGAFGRTINVQVHHLLRPPVGFYYNAYLRNDSSGALLDLGAVTSPFPDYASLIDADVTTGGTVNDFQIVDGAVRVQSQSDTELCGYNRIEVRLEPKVKAAAILPQTIAIHGANPYPTLPRCP